MNDNLDRSVRRSFEGKFISSIECDGSGISRATLLKSRELNPLRLFACHQCTVMRPIPPAARRKIAAGICRKRKQRRDQRHAKQEQQRNGQYSAHIVIVAYLDLRRSNSRDSLCHRKPNHRQEVMLSVSPLQLSSHGTLSAIAIRSSLPTVAAPPGFD
jgi:hypothetical protein